MRSVPINSTPLGDELSRFVTSFAIHVRFNASMKNGIWKVMVSIPEASNTSSTGCGIGKETLHPLRENMF